MLLVKGGLMLVWSGVSDELKHTVLARLKKKYIKNELQY